MADDHGIFRDGFKVLLKEQNRVQLVSEASDGDSLLEEVRQHQPDVVITDIKMPRKTGIEACREIKAAFPETKVIALSMFNDDHLILDMLEAGASGYLLKNTNREELLDAIQTVNEGDKYFSPATSAKLAQLIARSKYNPFGKRPATKFSPREIEVIRLICEQLTTKEIAARLQLSVRTVEKHRDKIQQKAGAKNSVGVVIYAIKYGIYDVGEGAV